MNSKELRQRKFNIMKLRMQPGQSQHGFQERHMALMRDITNRQLEDAEVFHTEMLAQSRRSSNVLEKLVGILVTKSLKETAK